MALEERRLAVVDAWRVNTDGVDIAVLDQPFGRLG